MGRKSNTYSRVPEAEDLIKRLCEKYAEVLWTVRPETIAVLGIENKERSEKNHTLAKIKAVKGTEKAIYMVNNIPIRYIIELYWSDYQIWDGALKQAILFHELLHVHPEFERVVKHDCEDFRIVLNQFGVDWSKDTKKLPNLLTEDVKFDLSLRPVIEDMDEDGEGDDNIDEDDKVKETKAKKGKKADKGTEDIVNEADEWKVDDVQKDEKEDEEEK